MPEAFRLHAIRPSLFYKDTCPPCRQLSRVALVLSLGHVRRVPIRSEEAEAFYASYPEQRGRLVLRHGADVWFGLDVLKAIPGAVLRTWGRALASIVRPPGRHPGGDEGRVGR
jgi:predicted DCC family thiol-disulfide oxidoreductase YuxK